MSNAWRKHGLWGRMLLKLKFVLYYNAEETPMQTMCEGVLLEKNTQHVIQTKPYL